MDEEEVGHSASRLGGSSLHLIEPVQSRTEGGSKSPSTPGENAASEVN